MVISKMKNSINHLKSQNFSTYVLIYPELTPYYGYGNIAVNYPHPERWRDRPYETSATDQIGANSGRILFGCSGR